MNIIHDISRETNNTYRLAQLISEGNYKDILYFEFHEPINNPTQHQIDGLDKFYKQCQDSYPSFFSIGCIDEMPTIIHVVVKIAGEWFLARECGSNYYLGYGPIGLIKMRKACKEQKIVCFYSTDDIDEWLKKKMNAEDLLQSAEIEFVKLTQLMYNYSRELQSDYKKFNKYSETEISGQFKNMLGASYSNVINEKAINGEKRADLCVKTDTNNEFIFEFKKWHKSDTIEKAITQLTDNYLSQNHDFAGVVIIFHLQKFDKKLQEIKTLLDAKYGNVKRVNKNSFDFKIPVEFDCDKRIHLRLLLVSLPNI